MGVPVGRGVRVTAVVVELAGELDETGEGQAVDVVTGSAVAAELPDLGQLGEVAAGVAVTDTPNEPVA